MLAGVRNGLKVIRKVVLIIICDYVMKAILHCVVDSGWTVVAGLL